MTPEPTPDDWLAAFRRAYARHKQRKAASALQRDVDARRDSYDVRRYRERRAAALKGLSRG